MVHTDLLNLIILFLFLLAVYIAVYGEMFKYLKTVYQEIGETLEETKQNKIISIVYIVLIKWRLTVVYIAIILFLLIILLNVAKSIFLY